MRHVRMLAIMILIGYSPMAMADSGVDPSAAIQKIKALGGNVERSATGKSTSVVTISLLGCTKLKDDDLAFLNAFPDVTELMLAGATGISDEGLKHLAACKQLKSLGLARTAVTNEGMKEVAKLKLLERLQLSHTSISDIGITNLGRQPNLRSLVLIGTSVTDKCLKELAEFKNLAVVNVKQSRVTDDGLKWLRNARPNMECVLPFVQLVVDDDQDDHQSSLLALEPQENDSAEQREALQKIKALDGSVDRDEGGKVTSAVLVGSQTLADEDLEFLKHFPDLDYLAIGFTNVSSNGLKQVPQCTKLTILSLVKTRVDDEGLKEVAKLKHLERLLLSLTSITDVGIVNLGRMPNLQSIMLDETAITDEGIKELAEFKNLKLINLAGSNVTEEGINWLRKTRPDIRVIDGNFAGGGQRSDPDFDTTVPNSAYTMTHPFVLFDEAHQNFHTATGRYKPFAELMTNDGYVIRPGVSAFTPELLSECQILIIANATTNSESTTSAFTSEECDCVKEWVNSGGSLLLVTDHEPYGSGSADMAKLFGVEMTCRVAFDDENETENGLLFSRENLQIGNHPIMTGRSDSERVNRILTFTGQTLKGPPDCWQLLRLSDSAVKGGGGNPQDQENEDQESQRNSNSAAGECQGLALKFGKGRVVVMGEAAELTAQAFGGNPPNRFGMNVPGCDNRTMVMNMMHWLSHLPDFGD